MTTSTAGSDPMVAGRRETETERPSSGPLRCSKPIRVMSGSGGLDAARADATLHVGTGEAGPARRADPQEDLRARVAELLVVEHPLDRAGRAISGIGL